VALMGPSGAGKTTLLNCLVGRSRGSEGKISYNGEELKQVRRSIGYVTQEDIMYETLTPRENLTFTCALIYPELSLAERQVIVEEVMQKLKLQKCADTVVGSPGLVRGISGGEKKRTNVALSLLGSPTLLLLDEPTSGLDSKMSDSLMSDLKQVASQGCTVIATIHQPSEAVFARFDKVLLLVSGQVAFYGLVEGLRESLQSLGFPCADGVPLPELLLDGMEPPASEGEQEAHRNRLYRLRQLSHATDKAQKVEVAKPAASRRANFCQQLGVLLRRELVSLKRNTALTAVRCMQSVAASFLIGFIFLRLKRDLSGVQTRLFSGFLLVFAQFLFAMLGVVNAFPAERAAFLRESQDKLYHPDAFYVAKVLVDTLMQCLFPILVVVISYPLVGLNTESLERVLFFYVIMCIVSNCGSAMGFAISAAVPSVSMALSIAPGLVMPQLLLSGIFIKVEDLPQPFGTLSYLMVARYAVQATVNNEFTCSAKDACDRSLWQNRSGDFCSESPCDFCCSAHDLQAAGGLCPVLSCEDALQFLKMESVWPSGDTHGGTILYNIAALLVLLLYFRLLGMSILMMSHRHATTGRFFPCAFRMPRASSAIDTE